MFSIYWSLLVFSTKGLSMRSYVSWFFSVEFIWNSTWKILCMLLYGIRGVQRSGRAPWTFMSATLWLYTTQRLYGDVIKPCVLALILWASVRITGVRDWWVDLDMFHVYIHISSDENKLCTMILHIAKMFSLSQPLTPISALRDPVYKVYMEDHALHE